LFQEEEKVKFLVGNAFYRPQSKIVRDLGVLAGAVYKQEKNELKVLDGMSGCGVRSLRYFMESEATFIHSNEANPEILPILKSNLQSYINPSLYQVSSESVQRIFFSCYNDKNYYDLVDVDCFGSANPHLSNMIWATKLGGLMYITSTDGRSLTGILPQNSLRNYGSFARNLPIKHEQGLRLLIGKIQQSSAEKGLGIEPIFSYFTGNNYRVMVKLTNKVVLTENNYGFLGYCQQCGEYQTVAWRKLGRVICNCEENSSIILSGAMWLGNLHNPNYLQKMIDLAIKWDWQKIVLLLTIMEKEANLPPYFYSLKEIGKRGKLDLPKRELLIQELQKRGYDCAFSHVNSQSIKTNASLHKCVETARFLTKKF
jgi:tRNA (guanine26-N2/guanine27-N2)-dimethyltransferase